MFIEYTTNKVYQIQYSLYNIFAFNYSALMEEQLERPMLRTALINMNGEIKLSKSEVYDDNSDCKAQCKSGEVGLIQGHAESWGMNIAIEILETLKKKGQIVGTFLDEFQMNLADHWGSDFWCSNFI